MIFYMPMPLDLLGNEQPTNIIKISLPSGGHVRAQAIETNKVQVIDLISTDPMDFLDERLQPGRIIQLKPSL